MKPKQDADELRSQYMAGSRFIEACRAEGSGVGDTLERSSLAIGTPGRKLAETMSISLRISFEELKPMSEFAFAVNTLVRTCGSEVLNVIFDPANPQSA